MARTPGSGWGAGPLLYQVCPKCGKKKGYYYWSENTGGWLRCIWCKQWSQPPNLIRCLTVAQYAQTHTN